LALAACIVTTGPKSGSEAAFKKQIILATPHASENATLERDGWALNQGSVVDAIVKYDNAQSYYGGATIALIEAIASCANDLLWSAYEGKYKTANLVSFLQGPAMKDPIFAPARQAATNLGIQQKK